MAIIASLVIGVNGATTLGGQSAPLSTTADRQRFLNRHRSAAAIIVGRNSAAIEDYRKTQVPIYVLSRSQESLLLPHPMMEQVRVDGDLTKFVRTIAEKCDGDLVIESGIALLLPLIDSGVVDLLELSISPIAGDGNFIHLEDILAHFSLVSEVEIDGTRLLECRNESDSPNS
jgi:riboflavin biosynthesis pyrimidine reductase